MRIAMWSGPRNLSTALMYAFGNRADFAVVDEPFYAAYLAKTGIIHPMRSEILAAQPNDPAEVIDGILGPVPAQKAHFYQKHMAQHMVASVDRGWMAQVTNVFLIRHPARVVASYAAKREGPGPDDIGFWQQAELFDEVRARGNAPLVIDSHDIRENPERTLRALCKAVGLRFDPVMLVWQAGGHKDDGAWAAHWYGAVHQSCGFAGPEGGLPALSGDYASLAKQALPHYEYLRRFRL
ncbi:MAG: HAD family hydrolase [Halocynthiibacter sp.]